MSLLAPLGLLGLLSIVALIIIYLIKPNFQQKVISSTFVWKLSLKFKKKKLPINRLRNILLFLCQVLILGICAMILAQPVIKAEAKAEFPENVAIIDASGDMMTEENGETRFERAIDKIETLARETLSNNGFMTIIYAGKEPSYIVRRISGVDSMTEVSERLKELTCTYGNVDIDGAIDLAEPVLRENPDTEVLLYSATSYIDSGIVKLVDVSGENEWNAAILNCTAEVEENYYTFYIDVASYGMEKELTVYCDVFGVNDSSNSVKYKKYIRCGDDKGTQTLILNTRDDADFIYSYDYIHVYLDSDDSLSNDNSFYLYGGTRQVLNVQYYSSAPNSFFSGILMGLRDTLSENWDINIKEVKKEAPALEGFDVYIFEHTMPSSIPTDGLVILADMDIAPEGSGLKLGEVVNGEFTLAQGETNPITANVSAENIFVTRYTRVILNDGYEALMYCGGDPVILAKNTPEVKVVAMSFSLNKSNFAMLLDFPVMLYNIFGYYFPSTVTQFVFDVNEEVSLNARGDSLNVQGTDVNEVFDTFPSTMTLSTPGTYTLTQRVISGKEIVESFYVKIPASESNIFQVVDSLDSPYVEKEVEIADEDLLIYFAIALVVLLFAEWWLHSREQI